MNGEIIFQHGFFRLVRKLVPFITLNETDLVWMQVRVTRINLPFQGFEFFTGFQQTGKVWGNRSL